MAHLTTSVEYGTHSLLWLVDSGGAPVSARDLAEFQGIPQAFLAKILSKLEKAGLVHAAEGVRGGYVLAREPGDINFLQIVDAIEGKKPLFDCQDIRNRCVLFGETPPRWATKGVCSIHAVMLRAEKAMRDTLASTSLADVARSVERKAPQEFAGEVQDWLATRVSSRGGKARPPEAMLDDRADPAPRNAVPTARRTLINSNPES
ncbi:RrF2 family transcriptional regulator [Hyphomonas johnsonii]|uniref:Rrf2 family transcriptional regulator n=1 Tax=Hyphomonas johnsonii MHS-2 TaxID=1280950 RepID=A0A059FTS4_9PROT|nr:Rrf2 family transcriptional regulator [Hyphomonas johnsonii]KCZ94080.1 Rrf2 family transcriptional regulator [Hyphomonas johnsonii MHS-2]